MKRFATILTTIALILAIFVTPAQAMPNKFKDCPQVKQNGITYLLYKECAIVRKTPNRKIVTIPNKIKVNGKKYVVRAIWDHTFEMTPKLRKINLKATSLECIEDPAIFKSRKIKVVAHDSFTYNWLKRNNVNVIYKH